MGRKIYRHAAHIDPARAACVGQFALCCVGGPLRAGHPDRAAFFSKFDIHPTIARVRKICPIRLIKLDDLIVAKDKYGMTLTYALHRAFSDLGPAMTEHWQIFLNADFILADGSLRNVIHHLSSGERVVASPSYCTIAEEVVPELRKHFNAATSTLSI